MEIKIGHSFTQEITVQHKDTAAVYGSGKLEVFATPAMVGPVSYTHLCIACKLCLKACPLKLFKIEFSNPESC